MPYCVIMNVAAQLYYTGVTCTVHKPIYRCFVTGIPGVISNVCITGITGIASAIYEQVTCKFHEYQNVILYYETLDSTSQMITKCQIARGQTPLKFLMIIECVTARGQTPLKFLMAF